MAGSMTMQDVRGEKDRRNTEEEAERARIEANKVEREAKKAAAAAAELEMHAKFEACEHMCACGIVPCPFAKWVRCPQCGPKKGVCRVKKCVEARQPLMLTYAPAEAEMLALPAPK